MDQWKAVARIYQQEYLKMSESGDLDLDQRLLRAKVSLVIYGPPPLDWIEEEKARAVTDAIVRESSDTDAAWASLVVVVVQPSGGRRPLYCHPVFRVNNRFVDCIGRVYKSWGDFVDNNKLPEGDICFPKDGVYRRDATGRVALGFGQRHPNDLLTVLDTVDSLYKIFSLGVAAAHAWDCDVDPDVEAVDAVGCAVSDAYGAARALSQQLDRDAHGQSAGSLENWACIAARATTVGRSRIVRPSKEDVAHRAVGLAQGLLTSSDQTPPEMLRDIRDDLDQLRGGGAAHYSKTSKLHALTDW